MLTRFEDFKNSDLKDNKIKFAFEPWGHNNCQSLSIHINNCLLVRGFITLKIRKVYREFTVTVVSWLQDALGSSIRRTQNLAT